MRKTANTTSKPARQAKSLPSYPPAVSEVSPEALKRFAGTVLQIEHAGVKVFVDMR